MRRDEINECNSGSTTAGQTKPDAPYLSEECHVETEAPTVVARHQLVEERHSLKAVGAAAVLSAAAASAGGGGATAIAFPAITTVSSSPGNSSSGRSTARCVVTASWRLLGGIA